MMNSGDLTKSEKQASPLSTSGDGYVFEHSVQAFFIVQMITGGLVPRMGNCEVTRVVLQADRYRRNTDDCEVTLRDKTTEAEKTLLVQIKQSFKLSRSNDDFTKTIQDAWKDFNSENFDKRYDRIMLVSGSLDGCGVGLKNILTHIQSSYRSADKFWSDYDRDLLGRSKQELEGLNRLHEKLQLANDNTPLTRDKEFNFFKIFFIVRSDMHESLLDYGDINIILIHSILTQKTWKDGATPQIIWERLCNYVATRNKNQIELVKDSLPPKLLEIFEEEKIIQQSDAMELTDENQTSKEPEPPENNLVINTEYKKEFALLCLIGKFDSANPNDIKAVSRLLKCDDNFLPDIVQSIHSSDNQTLELKGTTWKVIDIKSTLRQLSNYIYDNNISAFADIYLEILSEINPALDLAVDERYMANIYGKTRDYSDAIRNGVANGMAMLANNQIMFSNCSANSIGNAVSYTIDKLLSNAQSPKLWMSIADNASLIAQASPAQFLSKLENTLAIKDNNPIKAVIKESSGDSFFQPDYMTGLRWALADLSWDKRYFSQASLALAKVSAFEMHQSKGEGRDYSLDIILHTVLPWRPKTLAPIAVQHSVVEKIINEHRDIGRKLLKGLLPNVTQTTMEREAPEWMAIGNNIQPVTQQKLWEESSYYSGLYASTAKSPQEVVDVIKNIDHLTNDAFSNFIDRLSKRLRKSTDKYKQTIWEVLLKKINDLDRHDKDEHERAKTLKDIANSIEPTNALRKSIYLFSNYDHELISYSDWKKGEEDLKKRRQQALLSILNSRNANHQIKKLINQAKLPRTVGLALGSIDYPSLEDMLLPKLLKGNESEKEFINSFIYARYFHYKGDMSWTTKLGLANWDNEHKILFLLALPFIQSTWDLLDSQQDGNVTKGYWKRVDNFRYTIDDNYSEAAIKNLLKAKRPLAAIGYIDSVIMKSNDSIKQQIDSELCLEALMASLCTTESASNTNRLRYEIGSVFKYLYDSIDYTKTNLWEAEWAYLKLFGEHGTGQPRALTYRIANDAEFFCELVKTAYRSDLPGVKKQKLGDAIQYRLLKILSFNDFAIMPGIDIHGTFHKNNFTAWIEKVENACAASGHLDIAQSVIGGYLINSPKDKSGLWIHKAVAETLDRNNSVSMRSGYNTGIRNARGVHEVDETGKSEASLRDKWQKRADEIESLGFLKFAVSLRELADAYEQERKSAVERGLFRD